MEQFERTVKILLASFASLVLVMMLALGALAITNASTSGGISSLLAATRTSTQAPANNAVAVKDPVATTAPADTAQQPAPTQQQSGVVDATYAVKKTGPAVVTVVNNMQPQSNGRGRFGSGGQSAEALGSGVIFDNQGHIITNQHVVANQQSLQVIFADGTKVPATLVGEDAYSDIAVIKVDAKVPAVAAFGNSDTLQPGQPVIAIGTALGNYTNTVTEGIVSALHRQLGDGSTSTQDLVQTDAAINHGNSGGPLLDLSGNVVGINTAVVRSDGSMGDVAEGLGFAIPSNTAMNVAQGLMKNGSISRPYLGITYQPITPDLATANNLPRQQGVLVTDVAAGSPAEKAGIQANSIITKIDGVTLTTDNNGNSNLITIMSQHKVGDTVTLSVLAPGAGSEKDISVVLGQRPSGQ